MEEESVIGETVLHAYFDGELDESEIRDVEHWLENRPSASEDLRVWLSQKKEVKKFYDPITKEVIPAAMKKALEKAKSTKQGGNNILKLLLIIILLGSIIIFIGTYYA